MYFLLSIDCSSWTLEMTKQILNQTVLGTMLLADQQTTDITGMMSLLLLEHSQPSIFFKYAFVLNMT